MDIEERLLRIENTLRLHTGRPDCMCGECVAIRGIFFGNEKGLSSRCCFAGAPDYQHTSIADMAQQIIESACYLGTSSFGQDTVDQICIRRAQYIANFNALCAVMGIGEALGCTLQNIYAGVKMEMPESVIRLIEVVQSAREIRN